MKQTLFEAEAVLSVNTDKMFADLEKAARDAKNRLQSILGSVSAPTLGGGGRGGSGGGKGGGGGKNNFFSEQMQYGRLEKSAGEYSSTIARMTNLLENYKLTALQAAKAEELLRQARVKQNALQGKLQKQYDNSKKGSVSSTMPKGEFSNEMALAQGEKAAGNYGQAIGRLTSLLRDYELTSLQAIRAQNALDAVERKRMATVNRAVKKGEDAKEQAIRDARRPGAHSRINPFRDEMAEIRLLRNTREYAQALTRVNQLLNAQLNAHERIQVLNLQNNIRASQDAFTQQGGVDPQARRRNAQVQNLSFAFQDFATVLSMGGGMSRALASASNNIAFMTSMMGTLGGAAIGLAVTLGAIFIPSLIQAGLGFQKAEIGAERLKKRIDELSKAMENYRKTATLQFDVEDDMEEARKSGNTEELRDKVKSSKRSLEIEQNILRARKDMLPADRRSILSDFYKQHGKNIEDRGLEIEEQWKRDVISGKITPEMIERGDPQSRKILGTWAGDEDFKKLAEALRELRGPVTEAEGKVEDAAKAHEAYVAALARIEAEVKKAEANFNMHRGWITDIQKRDDAVFNRRRMDENFELKGNFTTPGLEKRKDALKSVFESLFPKEAEIKEITKKWKNVAGGDLANLSPEEKAVMDYEMSLVKNPSKGEFSGQIGGSEFASQLTGMLSRSDPQTKLTEFASRQVGLQERIAKAVEAAEKRLNELETSPFLGN